MKKILVVLLIGILSFYTFVSYANESNSIVKVVNDLGEYKIIAHQSTVYWHGVIHTYKDYGVVDKDGKVVVEQKYSYIKPPSEGRAAFKTVDGNIGFFDENWNIVIEPKYFSNGPEVYFSEGLAAVGKRDADRYILWGYIDRDGNEIIDFTYDYAEAFKDGIAVVGINERAYFNTQYKYGKINKQGEYVQPLKFDYALEMDYDSIWKDPVDVQLSQNLIEINGRLYKNSDIEYPFINYLGYSYMPLTYHGSRMLGINCDWTPETGVVLSGGGTLSGDIVGENGMTEGVLEKAMFYRGKLTVNGTLYEYGDTAFPLIHYKNVVYIPVLWEKGMESLGIKYDYVGPEKIPGSDRGKMVFTR
ncbi:MAG: WG repeat-containing protein [Clostridia bacterium]|nr:WG repeat-containing protein [Clostridia bacterium]